MSAAAPTSNSHLPHRQVAVAGDGHGGVSVVVRFTHFSAPIHSRAIRQCDGGVYCATASSWWSNLLGNAWPFAPLRLDDLCPYASLLLRTLATPRAPPRGAGETARKLYRCRGVHCSTTPKGALEATQTRMQGDVICSQLRSSKGGRRQRLPACSQRTKPLNA